MASHLNAIGLSTARTINCTTSKKFLNKAVLIKEFLLSFHVTNIPTHYTDKIWLSQKSCKMCLSQIYVLANVESIRFLTIDYSKPQTPTKIKWDTYFHTAKPKIKLLTQKTRIDFFFSFSNQLVINYYKHNRENKAACFHQDYQLISNLNGLYKNLISMNHYTG